MSDEPDAMFAPPLPAKVGPDDLVVWLGDPEPWPILKPCPRCGLKGGHVRCLACHGTKR